MKLQLEKLEAAVAHALANCYVLTGDEPLQMGEAADLLRATGRKSGYLQREVLLVDARFDWRSFAEAAMTRSLFGDKRIIELRFANKPDKEASTHIRDYLQHPDSDVLLILMLPRITQDDMKLAWFKALDAHGVVVQIWPPEGQDLLRWLDRRLSRRGLLADQSGLRLLAARVEGNLLAAAQAVELLFVLYGAGKIDDQQIIDVIANNARFDVFNLAEALLLGQGGRSQRILRGLASEGVAAPVVLWAMTRELRVLVRLWHGTGAGGQPHDTAWSKLRIWDRQKPRYMKALHRVTLQQCLRLLKLCSDADLQIKGQKPGDPWLSLSQIALGWTHPESVSNQGLFSQGL